MSGFVSMREYVDGDDPRMIHWPTTARAAPTIREHVEVRRPEFTIVLDTAATAGGADDFEEGVDVVATLAVHAIRTGLDVVVRTTDRDHPGRPIPLVSDAQVLDLLTPVQQSEPTSLLPVSALFAGGFDQSSVVFVTGPDRPVESFHDLGADVGGQNRRGCDQRHRCRPRRRRRPRVRPTMEDVGMTEPVDSVDPAIGARSLVRLRIVVLLVGYATVGAAASGIFDRFEWALLVAPVAPTIAVVTLVGRHGAVRAVGAAAAIIGSVAIAVVANSGGTSDILDAFTSGVQGLLSTDWPSPDLAELIGTVVAVIATATAISDELAARRRFHLLPLLPLLLCYLGTVALSSPRGITWSWLILLGAVAASFAMLRNDGTLHDRLVLLRGERRIVTLLLIGGAVVALITIPVSLTARADPRRNDPAQQTAPLLDPIEATLALRALDPPIALHRVTPADGVALPVRWRTAALSNYDGRRWSPALTLRPIGRTLGPVTGPVVKADVEFLDDNLILVPLPGAPVSVDAAVETDPERTVVRLAEPPDPGDRVAIVANLPPTASDVIEQGTAARLVDESDSSLADLAAGLAGDGSTLDQLTQLETTMREEFVLDSNVQGGGLQQALIDRFLRDTQRGTAEQFATAFVLLTRSLGIEARVATGFVADGEPDGSDTAAAGEVLTLSSADAEVWPEVQLTDGRWLAFDPVPAEESTIEAPPPPEPQVQTPPRPGHRSRHRPNPTTRH